MAGKKYRHARGCSLRSLERARLWRAACEAAGETLTVMGASGVGKSVLWELLIRLLEIGARSITFHDEEVSTMTNARMSHVRQRIAMLFQGATLFDSISVGENVAYIAVGTPTRSARRLDPRVTDFVRGSAPADEDVQSLLYA